MAYNQETDLLQIQADVLMTSTKTNDLIPSAKKFKTTAQNAIAAINENANKIKNALTNANDAVSRVSVVEKTLGISENTGETSETGKVIPIAAAKTKLQNDEIIPEENGQTIFSLSLSPIDTNNILFFVNGVKYKRSDTRYNSENNTIEWLNTNPDNKGFAIMTTDDVSIIYMSNETT